jgi:DNA-binding Lrp family transcriptional regulator
VKDTANYLYLFCQQQLLEKWQGSDILRKKTALDRKDLRILTELDKMGGNASAQELSEVLKDIPARTIRYRISVLKERGILLPSFIQTDERKLGLGEGILILQESSGMSETLERLIQDIPIFFWFVPTHGKYNGYLVHTMHDLANPKMINDLCKTMKDQGIIDDYHFFDIVDYESKSVDFSHYLPSGKWSWDWDMWNRGLNSNLQRKTEVPFDMRVNHDVIDCDIKDIQILRQLKQDSGSSINDLARMAQISTSDARERVQKLRDNGVIKGHLRAYGFTGDFLWFSCFLEVGEMAGGVLTCFNELPFPGGILMESPNRYCLRFGFTTHNLKQFLDGFMIIRPHLKSYFFQFHLTDRQESRSQDVFQLFDENGSCWKIPLDDYISQIRQY